MTIVQAPMIRTLERRDCLAVLVRNRIGRLAFSFHDRVDIVPIHYVCEAEWIYGRTSPGAKLEVIRHNQWVAFEVDEVHGLFEWQSVVVHGGFRVLSDDGPPEERKARERALQLLRRLIPETSSAADPVPFRTVIFRIHVDEVSGRKASMPGDAG